MENASTDSKNKDLFDIPQFTSSTKYPTKPTHDEQQSKQEVPRQKSTEKKAQMIESLNSTKMNDQIIS